MICLLWLICVHKSFFEIPHNWIVLSNEVLFQFFTPEVNPKIKAQELGLQRMSFTETLRAEVEASRLGPYPQPLPPI